METTHFIVLESSALDIWAFVVSALSVLITTILTIYTIRQNTKLNRKQQELQLYIQERQEIDNATALKLSNRQYAEKVYEIAFEIFAFTELIGKHRTFIKSKSYEQCCAILDAIFTLYPNIEKDSRYLIIGEHYLTNGLDSTVMELKRAFDDLMQEMMLFRLPKEILTNDEITKEYKKSLDNVYFHIDRIDKTKQTLIFMKETQFKL